MSGAADLGDDVDARGLRVAVVAARFHAEVVDALLDGARAEFSRLGGAPDDLRVMRVPGAFEVPVALEAIARRGGVDALVALACVVRGETPHFDHVCHAVTVGCEAVARAHVLPVGFGVLTVDDLDQARRRVGGSDGDKGAEALHAAVSVARAIAAR